MAPSEWVFTLPDPEATERLGGVLAELAAPGLVIYLQGQLGAGKTTLARGLLRQLGYADAVKSPTYTLLEPYALTDLYLCHLDLYRLADAEELEFIGLRDFIADGCLLLIEWPERGDGILPPADLQIILDYLDSGRRCRLSGRADLLEKFVTMLQTHNINS